ncbi:peptidase c40 [Diplodia corticola]|uniref:Peptidase c40 n=1 Tax=Diplodia corticola TaxID=236234 RepID=A0A1J9R3V2_9PEZI|nr:peptidase c40 [Diplodia corticola]OJD35257.1 peptidase c40 [Diplodia corticola]
MPVHPAEETATGDITDQVAKASSDSTASSHPLHDTESNVTSGGSNSKAHASDHKAHPGPVIVDDIGKPASKEELKARAAELNK